MYTFIVVTYSRTPLAGKDFQPGECFSFENFDEAMTCFDNYVQWAYAELWFYTPELGWHRMRFQTNHQDHNNFVG